MAKFSTPESQLDRLARRPDALFNYEGGLAFRHDLRETLVKMAACCLVSEPTFYQDTTDTIRGLFAEAAGRYPEWTAKLAVYLRQTLHLRSVSQLAFAVAAREPAARPFLRKAFDRVLQRTDDLIELAALVKDDRHGLFRATPHFLRREIRRRLEGLGEREAIAYRRAGGVGLKHLVRLYHPRPADARQNALLRYALGGRLTEGELDGLPVIRALRAVQAGRDLDGIVEHRLPWECVVPAAGSRRDVWARLGLVLPFMALLRNLRNLHEHGALQEPGVRRRVLALLQDPEAVAASRQLPFRWWSAHRVMVERDPEVAGAVARALELSAANLPRLPGTTAIWCDHSGSMQGPISGHADLTPQAIANLLGAVAQHLSDDAVVGAFGDRYREIAMPTRAPIMANVHRIARVDAGCATFAHLAVESLLATRRKVDRAIILTDCILWSPRREAEYANDQNFYTAWTEYRRRVNPSARAYVWNLQPNEFFVEPAGDERIVTLSGWSEGILRYIGLSEQGPAAQVAEVEGIAL